MTVKAAFMIFGSGVPSIIEHLGMDNTSAVMAGPVTGSQNPARILHQFFPEYILCPRSDGHPQGQRPSYRFGTRRTGQTAQMPDVAQDACLRRMEINVGLRAEKDNPLLLDPGTDSTFLLPQEFQILFAALLSTVLGVILALSGQSTGKQVKIKN